MTRLFILTLLLLAVPRAQAQLYVPNVELRTDIQDCQAKWPDVEAADTCLFELAQAQRSPLVCNYIQNNNLHLRCHQSLPHETWDTSGFLHASPLVIYFLVLIGLLTLRPPRGPYITGMLIGAFAGLLWLYLRGMPFEWLQTFQPYLPLLAAPADGLLRFSPSAFSLWPFAIKFITVHVIVYGAVVGTLLQGERRALGFLLLFFALLLTYWDHPVIAGIRGWFQALGG